jgi:hypothetical protein
MRPSVTIDELREQQKIGMNERRQETLRKAKKRLTRAKNCAMNELKALGIQARKNERARLQRLKDYTEMDEMLEPKDLVCFREPDKQPTMYGKMKTADEFYYPELVQQIRELEKDLGPQIHGDVDVIIILEHLTEIP